MIFSLIAVGSAIYVAYGLYQDSQTREQTYTRPLATMPNNARDLVLEMLDVAVTEAEENDSPLNDSEIKELRLELMKMMAEGAVEQRNWEMKMTRDQISYVGAFLSWFMKQKGLTYEQIEDKYTKQFPHDELQKFEEIIKSASRANPNVFEKLVAKITGTAQRH